MAASSRLFSLKFSPRGAPFSSSQTYTNCKTKKSIGLSMSASADKSLHKSEKDLHHQSKVEALLDSVKWDEKGLAVAIAQNIDTGAVLMQGFANKEALATTISFRKATFTVGRDHHYGQREKHPLILLMFMISFSTATTFL